MKRLLIPIVLGATVLSCSDGQETKLKGWEQPDEAYRIGRGYDPNAQESVRGDCLMNPEQYLETSWIDAQGIKAQISETRITSKENLYKELNLTANAKVKYGAFSGGGSYSQYEKFASTEDGFTWLFSLKAAIGTKTLQTERIDLDAFKPEARALILAAKSGDQAAKKSFFQMCGTQYVRSVRLGGALTDVLEISAKAVDEVKEISAKMKASVGGISGNASYDSIFSRAAKNSFFKREYQQIGGEQIEFQITDENVKAVLDKFVKDLKQQNAAVIEVEMADWNTIVNFAPSDPVDIARSIRIDQLLRQLWRYQDTLQKIDTLIYLHDQGTYEFTAQEAADLRKAYNDVTGAIDEVIALGRSCYADARACSQAITQVIVTLPKPKEKKLGNEAFYSTARWDLLFPSTTAALISETSGSTTVWRFNEQLSGRTLDGSSLGIQVDLYELSCRSVSDILTANTNHILPSFDSEPVYYTESLRSYPGGSKRYAATFGIKSGTICLQVHVSSNPVSTSGFSVVDDSQAARMIRRIISSIRTRN
jgi:hypothetical protein